MNTKRIVFATLMALVPFVANAEQTTTYTNTPSTVGANGTIKIANAKAPFATNEPTPADQTHIATTAYVKGAYNDAIAAVNKLNTEKQGQLYNTNGDPISSDLIDPGDFAERLMQVAVDGDINALAGDDELASAEAIMTAMSLYNGWVQQQTVNAMYDAIGLKRVTIYTTWDTNDTTKVQLSDQ